MRNKNNGFSSDVGNWLRGLCMGAADIVPGVSGGTIALILGHYQRLVTGISHIDSQFVRLLKQRKIADALQHCDFRFLVAIAIGMLSGVVALASLMHLLLDHYMAYTFAVFTGLILASSVLVARRLDRWKWTSIAWLCAGALFAWQLSIQDRLDGDLTPMRAFMCASVAICAMILPGISGAFVLLLLGVYSPVTELIKGLPKGEIDFDGFIIIATFALGCLFGLLAFSRVLKWLLANRHDSTMAVLVGLMIGSLYKIWPFQEATPETASLEFKKRIFEHLSPSDHPASLVIVVLLAVGAAATTFGLEKLGAKFAAHDSGSSE